jgi:hypothetical protein
MTLSILLSIILIALGLLHFYWALGGELGFSKSLPTKETGERVLNPKKMDSVLVGMGLTAFGIFYVFQTGLIASNLPGWITNYAGWIIPIIFLLRAMGEFNYVGFFKKVKTTEFGKLDTKYFSPFCLVIGILGILTQIMK